MPQSDTLSIFVALLLTGLLGMVGQGVRVLAGLKKLNDSSTQQGSATAEPFVAARLVVGC